MPALHSSEAIIQMPREISWLQEYFIGRVMEATGQGREG